MSDYVHGGRRHRVHVEDRAIESRAMFAACYALFLARAIVKRAMPWRKPAAFSKAAPRETVFGEAHNAASVMVASSFMGM